MVDSSSLQNNFLFPSVLAFNKIYEQSLELVKWPAEISANLIYINTFNDKKITLKTTQFHAHAIFYLLSEYEGIDINQLCLYHNGRGYQLKGYLFLDVIRLA